MNAPHSLRFRATLLTCACILTAICAYAAVAYRELEGVSVTTSRTRLKGISEDLASALETSTGAISRQAAELAEEPAIVAFLERGGPERPVLASRPLPDRGR